MGSTIDNTSALDNLLSSRPGMERMFRGIISVSDRDTVSTFLRKAKTELNRAKIAMISLKTKSRGLEEAIGRYEALLAPIHKLPPEALANVLAMVSEEGNTLGPESMPPTMIISHVCGRWRDVALSTPKIWSSIMIDFSQQQAVERSVDLAYLAQMFTNRSKPSLLDLKLDIMVDERADVDIAPALSILTSQSARWGSLNLTCYPWVLDRTYLGLVKGRLPELRHLGLPSSESGYVIDGDEVVETHLFDDCPNLESLSLSSTGPVALSRVQFPWKQIRYMKLDGSCVRLACSLISRCPNLHSLRYSLAIGGDSIPANEIEPITSSLKHLSISAYEPRRLSDILQRLTLPSLSFLDIIGRPVSETWDLQRIKDFLSRSSTANSLRYLRLEHPPMSDRELVSLLRMMPKLEHLCINERAESHRWPGGLITDTFLDQFNIISPIFLPRLSQIELTVNKTVPQGALLQMLVSRTQMDNTAQLRSVSIVIRKEISAKLRSSLEAIHDVGVCISVKVIT